MPTRDRTVPFDAKAWRAEWKAKRRAAGICVDCPRPAERPRVTCAVCAEKSKARKRAARAARQVLGKCRECELPARPGRGTCAICAEIARRQRRGKTVQTPEQRRRYKTQRRALGLCADCGEAAESSAVRCVKCADTHRERERLASKHGRPNHLLHLHKDLELWERALIARGQVRKVRGRFIHREKKAS